MASCQRLAGSWQYHAVNDEVNNMRSGQTADVVFFGRTYAP